MSSQIKFHEFLSSGINPILYYLILSNLILILLVIINEVLFELNKTFVMITGFVIPCFLLIAILIFFEETKKEGQKTFDEKIKLFVEKNLKVAIVLYVIIILIGIK